MDVMDIDNPECNFHPQLCIGVAQDIGRKGAQEDTFTVGPDVVAVFDGHGQMPGTGSLVSKHAAQHVNRLFHHMRATTGCGVIDAMKGSLAALEQEVLGEAFKNSGATVAMAAVHEGYLYACHMGDSPIAIYDKTNAGYTLRCLTNSHTPARPDQAEQVFRAGGMVRYGLKSQKVANVWQMAVANSCNQLPQDFSSEKYNIYALHPNCGGLMMTRALGDAPEKKTGIVTAEPEFLEPQKLNPDSLVVLASDALTDAFNWPEFTQHVNQVMALSEPELAQQCQCSARCGSTLGNNGRLMLRAKFLGQRILEKKRHDNMSIMLAQLPANQEAK
jgi:serine/threonine protein phosphatase PrpC